MAAKAKAANSAPPIKGLAAAELAVEQWPIGNIKPYEKNPRVISDKAIEKVANSLSDFGFRQPIVVDTKGIIIAGHTRHKAAQKLGLETVPVHVAKDLDAKKARLYRLADNKTGELADWLDVLLAEEVAALEGDGFDLTRFGFEEDGLDALMGTPDAPEGFADFGENIETEHQCPKCGYQWSGKSKAASDPGK